MAPFLSVVTRHMVSRPGYFAQHLASLAQQTDQDYQHIIIEDTIGRGMSWANAQFALHAYEVQGVYVLMLDDDDILAQSNAIVQFKEAARNATELPDMLIYRVNHGGNLGVLPDDRVWGQEPVFGHIGGTSFLTRTPLWQQFIGNFAHPVGGDFHFLEAIWHSAPNKVWLDQVLVKVLRTSYGAPE